MSGMERAQPLVIVAHKDHAAVAYDIGYRHIQVVDLRFGGEQAINEEGQLRIGWDFSRYLIALPPKGYLLRDDLAMRLGDDRCSWCDWPLSGADKTEIGNRLTSARPMWTDEVATIDDIPDPGPEQTFECGFRELDEHGFRFSLPAFMPIIGPYGSGKSVLLRQLLMRLWQMHGWKFLLTSFEERVKPRYLRDMRWHIIGKPYINEHGEILWSDEEIAKADAEIRKAAVFLRRKRNTTLDLGRLLDRIEFAVRVHGVRVVAIDPVNEIDHQVPKGESKTDYMGRFIMALKALADDYGLLMICCAHPPKDGVEKRISKKGLLTLNDGADTAHWGNKADIGWCVWRNIDGPTYLHADKLKDHETMGKPFLAELILNPMRNAFQVNRMGYHILADQESE
jgi:twinkle protein